MTSEVKVEQRHRDAAARHLSNDVGAYLTEDEAFEQGELADAFARFECDHMPVSAVPTGWKLVPVEPAEEMWEVFDQYNGDKRTGHGTWLDAWSAMLSAAPSPPIAGVDEEEVGRLEKLLIDQDLPWEVDTQSNEDGEYGPCPDPGRGYDDYMILAADGGMILGTENATHKLINEEFDEDGYKVAWDSIGKARAELVTAAVNALPSLLSERRAMQAKLAEAETRVELLGDGLFVLSDRLRAIGAFDSDNVASAYEKVVARYQALASLRSKGGE